MEQNRHPADGVRQKDETHDGGAGRQHAPEIHHHHNRSTKLQWWLLVAAMFIFPALLLLLSFQLRGTRYVMAQVKGMKILFSEPTFLLWHLVSYVSVGLGPWLLRYYGRNRKQAIWVLTLILVPLVLVVNTWNIASTTRSIVAQRAGEMCDDTYTSVSSQLNETPRSTSDLVILDQGIAKLMAYVHLIVRSEYPEFELRTASLHMVPSVTHKEKVWNVIQEGAQRKDGEFLDYPEPDPEHTSLVGMTIKEGKTIYCPDVTHADRDAACETFQSPQWVADPAFKSLICYPLQTSYNSKVFASLCFDSKAAHAFDGKELRLKERIDEQMNQLNGLLQSYRKQDSRIFQDTQDTVQPPGAAPKL
jgi:hypothetical protein